MSEELTHLKRPWCWERLKVGGKGMTEDEIGWMASRTQWTWVGWTLGGGDGQGGLVCCGSWSHKELNTTEWLNWTELNWVAQMIKNLLAMQETWAQFLGREDLLEWEWLPTPVLALRIPWTEEPDRLQSMGLQRVGHDWVTNTFTSLSYVEFQKCKKLVNITKTKQTHR